MRWGLIPSWAKDKKTSLINARADTVFTKPAFRTSAKRRRCLILADGYYEWKTLGPKLKQPYYFRAADSKPIAFAGIWDSWSAGGASLESCSIITKDANDLSAAIHDRMPVILRGEEADAWIDPDVDEPETLAGLLRPFPADEMVGYEVGSAVGSRRTTRRCAWTLWNAETANEVVCQPGNGLLPAHSPIQPISR
jgi:putative SOS response-associated peptidase YedK